MPKFKLLYFKSLLDLAFTKFFESYNDKFIKINGKYVLSANISKFKLSLEFRNTIVAALKELTSPYDILNPTYYIIIGACMPKDNILLTVDNSYYFPERLRKLIVADYQIKYLLKEKDIQIDIVEFNQICINVFNEFFAKNSIKRFFGNNRNNIIFLTHKNFDCYVMFKTLKNIYGKSNCINMHVEHFKDVKSPIVAVNDLIDRYTNNKNALNSNSEFKKAVDEIRTYLKNKILI